MVGSLAPGWIDSLMVPRPPKAVAAAAEVSLPVGAMLWPFGGNVLLLRGELFSGAAVPTRLRRLLLSDLNLLLRPLASLLPLSALLLTVLAWEKRLVEPPAGDSGLLGPDSGSVGRYW